VLLFSPLDLTSLLIETHPYPGAPPGKDDTLLSQAT
jgi:hypothetical protein